MTTYFEPGVVDHLLAAKVFHHTKILKLNFWQYFRTLDNFKVLLCRNNISPRFWLQKVTIKYFILTTMSKSSCKFLQLLLNCSDVAYSKYHNLFFIRLLNFWGFFSRSAWNLLQMAASWIFIWRLRLYSD